MRIKALYTFLTLILATNVNASDKKIEILDGCIVKTSSPAGEQYMDLSSIDSIKSDKGRMMLGDGISPKKIDDETKNMIIKEWLRCKASVNK